MAPNHKNMNNNNAFESPNMTDYYEDSNIMNNTSMNSRRKTRSIPKHLFAAKMMIEPNIGNISLNQFTYNSYDQTLKARFTGWYQILMDKTVNIASQNNSTLSNMSNSNSKTYFEIKILKSSKNNIMVGICSL